MIHSWLKKTRRQIQNSGNHSNKTRITAALLVFVLIGSGMALVFTNSDSESNSIVNSQAMSYPQIVLSLTNHLHGLLIFFVLLLVV